MATYIDEVQTLTLTKLDRNCKLIEYVDDCNLHQWIHYQTKDFCPNPELKAKTPVKWSGTRTFKLEWTDANNWHNVKTARESLRAGNMRNEYGLGFVLTSEANISVIDVDPPREPEPTPERVEAFVRVRDSILSQFPDTYAETSVSGQGVHIWCLREPNGITEDISTGYISGIKIEIFSGKKYVTVSGDFLPQRNVTLRNCQEAVAALNRQLRTCRAETISDDAPIYSIEQRHADELVIERIQQTERGRKLWAGDTSPYGGDHSSADFALCVMLTEQSWNREQVERLFLKSGLGQRDKANRTDYRDRTIDAAFRIALARMPEEPDSIPKGRASTPPPDEIPQNGGDKHSNCDRGAAPDPSTDTSPEEREVSAKSSAKSLRKKIMARTWRDIQEMRYAMEPLKGRSEGIFPLRHISLMGAPSGSGKTVLSALWCEHIRVGKEFCGHQSVRAEYRIISFDRSIEEVKLTASAAGLSAEQTDAVVKRFLDMTESDVEDIPAILDQFATEYPEARVWFIEGIDLISEKVSDSKTVSSELKKLRRIAAKHNIAVIGTMGSAKFREATGGYSGRDKLFGSTAWARKTSTILLLDSYPDEELEDYRKLTILYRASKKEKYYFQFTESGFLQTEEPNSAPSIPGETPEYRRMTARAKTIFKLNEPLAHCAALGTVKTYERWTKWAYSMGILTKIKGRYYLAANTLLQT